MREPDELYTLRLKVLEDANVTDEEREDILWRNTEHLFKLGEGVN